MKALVIVAIALSTFAGTAFARPDGTSETRLSRRERIWLGSPMSTGFDLGYVMTQYPNFREDGGRFAGAPMKGGRLALEWIPFGEATLGKLGVGIAAGYLTSEPKAVGAATRQLVVLPTEAYLAYRADFFHQQLFVPFAKVGANFTFYKNPDGLWYAYPGLDYSVGLELCLSHLEPVTARRLDTTFGINDTYLLVEYVRSDFLPGQRGPDLRNETVRVALRFEM